MTVTELLAKILAVYPGADGDAMKAIKGSYFARLQRHEGDKLEAAANEVFATFKPKYGQPFPIVADFEAHLPSGKLNLGGLGEKIDLDGRKRRADGLFANWRAGQGERAGKGIPMLVKALENMARPIADVAGWKENPEPLVLTRDQLKVAAQRAISQERRLRYGQSPYDRRVWWDQIDTVAQSWGMQQITPEWWDKETAKYMAIAARQTEEERAA